MESFSLDILTDLPLFQGIGKSELAQFSAYIPHSFVEYKEGEHWLPVKTEEETTTIGYKRLLRFDTVKADALRIRITDARGPLCMNRIALFFAEGVESNAE